MNSIISLRDFASRLRLGETETDILGPASNRIAKLVAPQGEVGAIADDARAVDFVISTATVDRATDTIAVAGWQLGSFKRNPVVLWSHDALVPAIARASNTRIENGALKSTATFAPRDIHPLADTVYQLVKLGFMGTCSVGFQPLKYQWATDKERPGGLDFVEQELLEWSICNIPCNPDCLVVGRANGIDTGPLREWAERILDAGGNVMIPRKLLEATFRAAKTPRTIRQQFLSHTEAPTMTRKSDEDWRCGAARDLAIDDEGAWDGPAAEASIFEHAGGDDFDPAKARLGFLAYDAAAPKLRGSYKLPFARVTDGELKAAASGIRAAASRLPDTGISESVRETARAVLDHYEAKMKDGKALGEGGDGAALVPSGNCGRDKDDACGMKDPAECAMHAPPIDDAVEPAKRRGAARRKAGRILSTANEADLRKAAGHHAKAAKLHEKAMDLHRDAAEHHKTAEECIKAVLARHDAAVYDPDHDGDNDTPGAGGDTDNDGGRGKPEDSDPFNFTSLRDSARKALAEARRDLTVA